MGGEERKKEGAATLGERILSSDINVRTVFKPPQQVVESLNQRAENRQAKGRSRELFNSF